jgi:hypothetical protein
MALASSSFRRAFRRLVPIPCQVVREHDFRLVADLALDLSTRGMLVRARAGAGATEKVLTGEEVVVSFRISGSSAGSERWFDALGTVARVVHGRRPGDRGVCLGLEFYGVKPEMERALFEQLRGIAGPEPSRPLRTLIAA